MKKLALLLLFAPVLAFAQIPVSREVDKGSHRQARAAAELARAYGYKCDSVDFFMRSMFDGAFHLTCNRKRYFYVVRDVGGRWIVEPR